MADLNVQPKKKSILPWILLLLGIIALLFFLLRGCNNNDDGAVAGSDTTATTTTDTGTGSAGTGVTTPPDTSSTAADGWGDVDFNAPAASYPEVSDTNISVRGGGNYGIYSLGENILFDEGKATIRKNAQSNLKQIAASIGQRYNGAEVRIFGYTDAVGSAGYNKELAEQRAQAVSEWLTTNGNVSKDKVSLQPVGEARPVASNATSQGRQQNRRVEIVARASGNQ